MSNAFILNNFIYFGYFTDSKFSKIYTGISTSASTKNFLPT